MSGFTAESGRPSPYVVLARNAVVAHVTEGRVLDLPDPLPPFLEQRAGVFVSLKKRGELRGCIGTIEPVRSSLAEEIIRNAIAASAQDPRFLPVQPHELREIAVSVDILSIPERVFGLDDFDPEQYGMILKCGARRGLLLPNLEGVDTVAQQFAIVCRKAGITGEEPLEYYRFTVSRYH